MRRGLGFKLHDAGVGLLNFVSFMERRHACRITTRLALEWALKSKSVLPAEWARRLSFVRGFARYRSAFDARTQIPPSGLLPYRPKRARPYFYTNEEIERLLAAAQDLPPAGGLKGHKYYCLFGLLSVSGLRISEALNLKLEDVDLHEGVLTIWKPNSASPAWCLFIRQRRRFSLIIYADAVVSRRAALLAMYSCPVPEIGWTWVRCTALFMFCHGKSGCAVRLQATDRAFTTSVIASLCRPCCIGTLGQEIEPRLPICPRTLTRPCRRYLLVPQHLSGTDGTGCRAS
jgi:integrase